MNFHHKHALNVFLRLLTSLMLFLKFSVNIVCLKFQRFVVVKEIAKVIVFLHFENVPKFCK